jgi:serine/threonine-protein kinase
LAACHQQGIFHGLLKPSNLMISADGTVHILDFGIGSLLAENEGESLVDTMSTANTMTSGLDCSSPESIMEPTNRTASGDQYSLGCCLYFFLTGQYPFPEGSAVEKMMAHQFKQPPSVRSLAPDVPAELEAIVDRLMQKKPEDRYAGTEDAAEALRPYAATSAAPPPPARPARAPAPAPAPARAPVADNGRAPAAPAARAPAPASRPPAPAAPAAPARPAPAARPAAAAPAAPPRPAPAPAPAAAAAAAPRRPMRDMAPAVAPPPPAMAKRELPPDEEEEDIEDIADTEEEEEEDEDEEYEEEDEGKMGNIVIFVGAILICAIAFYLAMTFLN